jgi:capsular polysaccharide biosynthesis protein
MAGLDQTLRTLQMWRGRGSLGRQVRRHLAGGPESRVVVLAASPEACDAVLGARVDGVLRIDPGLSGWVRHGRLAGAGPFDLLVDAADDVAGEVDRFRESFLHVRTGGTYVAVAASDDAGEQLWAFLRDLVDGGDGPGSAPERAALAEAVDEVRRRAGQLSVTRKGRTLAKLRESEMNEALAEDPSRGRILSSLPGVEFDSRCEMRVSRPPRRDQTKARYEVPELYLREYDDVTCRPKSVVVQRGLLCPDTYRHHLSPRLTHKMLKDAGPRFAVTPKNEPPAQRLEGTYFHLDNEIRGFFGHALTEQLSRLWAWREAQERHPGIKVLLSLNRGREVADWEYELLAAGGISQSDVVVIGGPVVVERLLSATPMFSMPAYVHPGITETWDAVGTTLRSRAGERKYPSRIFCTRQHDKRGCTNRGEVERLFASYGFEVVLPEQLPLPDQVQLFHRADVVAGFAGSGMFTTLFSNRPKHLILVGADTYGPSNEYMISAVRGHRLDLAIGHTIADGTADPLKAPFTVDMADEGAWLEDVLDHL